jgi:opacity protein-like surface antigen
VHKLACALALTVAFAGLGQAAAVVKPAPDTQIEHTIQQKYAKSKINADHFTVSVHGGVATIEGKTGIIQHKGVATRLAKTGGAISVKNHIQISKEAKAKAAANLSKNANPGASQVTRATVVPAVKAK